MIVSPLSTCLAVLHRPSSSNLLQASPSLPPWCTSFSKSQPRVLHWCISMHLVLLALRSWRSLWFPSPLQLATSSIRHRITHTTDASLGVAADSRSTDKNILYSYIMCSSLQQCTQDWWDRQTLLSLLSRTGKGRSVCVRRELSVPQEPQ